MNSRIVILIADDDVGHVSLIKRNFERSGVTNEIIHFKNGEEVLNFLFKRGEPPHREDGTAYLLLLDIRMPKVDGIEVLRQIKKDEELKKLPVTMLTTTDDPREIKRCHSLGCSNYIAKPVDYEKFVEAIHQFGLFLSVVEVPEIDGIEI
ncbi:MAG: response regulator [Halobacteriota archaeon]|nr:response regulator [Halobacteriota archaeon]